MKVLIRDSDGRVLLLRRSPSSKGNPGSWELPGGKIDPGETAGEALAREVLEETGLDIDVLGVAGHMGSVFGDRLIAYVVLDAELSDEKAGATVALSDEHSEFAWVESAGILELDLAPQYQRFFQKYLADGDLPRR